MKEYSYIINGVQKTSDKLIDVTNPANNESIGSYYVSTIEDVEEAVINAKKSQVKWARLSQEERDQYISKITEVLTTNKTYLAELITKEQGKPLSGPGSNFEMDACIGWTQVPTSLQLEDGLIFEDDTRKDILKRVPIGVVAAITPWNWPLMIAIWQIIPSLKMGNTVVIKPSEYTTIASLEMFRLINTVLPAGVLNCVTGDGKIGGHLTSHKLVGKIMFTGSIATGKRIIEASTNNMARLTLECGGNDAGIVLPKTDFDQIAEGLFWGSFLNMGQTCAALKRLYVHENDLESAVNALINITKNFKMGNGLNEENSLGPIQNKMQFDKVNELIETAKNNPNAKLFIPELNVPSEGYFIPITYITGVDNGDPIVDEEQFGPVLPIITYKTVEEAIEKANALEVGLGASVWGSDSNQLEEIVLQLEAGTVWINQHGAIHPFVPFGGVKQSGYGVEFGIEGLKAVTLPKIVSYKK
ncbi:aldehyde dehydrogenase family protein [Empedobacter tilapiae]|uniref:Aldehyde dehydrogenase family protein n=1 Tax=Empedobacter tilapiae TaxID=2491114 RepID=A0A4Z1BQH0_9FLAO|nr:aldehyde dehydrogenase family protein [Empedobacter tilapiae]TGN28000.1 aldehyde dehydrogenase family protein [Empedobacter tilapiae]